MIRENIKRKLNFIILQLSFVYVYCIVWIYSQIFKRKNVPQKIRKIAAIWYYPAPPAMTGDTLRAGGWRKYFVRDGFIYDNFYGSSIEDKQRLFDNASWSKKYRFYRKILFCRLRYFFKLRKYDVVWIRRGFLPFYPLKHAFFEKCIKRMVYKVVIDYCDGGDYQLNPQLITDTIKYADRLTVAYLSLFEFYKTKHKDVAWFNYALPTEKYFVKNSYDIKSIPLLGWMGSPGNMVFLKEIEPALVILSRKIPFKLKLICRDVIKLNIPGVEVEYCKYDDSYYRQLADFDIGLCPFNRDDFRSRGKVAMKHQEYMLCGIPQVCSPVAICEEIIDGEHASIARNMNEWSDKLYVLIKDKGLREKIGVNSRKLFFKLYTYDGEWPKVKRALTEW